MVQHRISGRVELSPAAERRFLQACKVKGGQTLFLEEAIEFFVQQVNILEKLDAIEQLIRSNGNDSIGTEASTPHLVSDVIADSSVPSEVQFVKTNEAVLVEQPQVPPDTPVTSMQSINTSAPKPTDAQKEPDTPETEHQKHTFATLRAFIGGDDD